MVDALHGEVSVRIYGRRCTFRPSLGALYEIEQALDATIPALIGLLQDGKGTSAMTRVILREGFAAQYGDMRAFPLLTPWQIRRLSHTALRFLIHGMGFLPIGMEGGQETFHAHSANNAADISAPDSARAAKAGDAAKLAFEPIGWRGIYENSRMLLGIGEAEFWQMTMADISSLSAMFARLGGNETAYAGPPATQGDLAWLIAQFPDTKETVEGDGIM